MRLILPAMIGLLATAAHADIVWTGATSNDIFDETNWDLSNSTVTVIDPNVTVDDNVVITNAAQPVEIPDQPAQMRFQIGDGYTLTLDNSTIMALANDGIGGVPGTTAGPMVVVINGAQFNPFFIVNDVSLDLTAGCAATFGGGGDPINVSTVNLTAGATLAFLDETVAAYTTEHLSKTTVDWLPAVIGTNLQVVSDGVVGCIVTVPSQFVTYCPGDGIAPHSPCPCVNNNNGGGGGCDWGDLSFPEGGILSGTGSLSMSANDTMLTASGVSNNFGVFFGANNQVNGGNGNPLNDGLRCAGGGLVRLIPPTMAVGNMATTPAAVQTLDTGASPGVTRRYQYWFRTPAGPCGQMANLTNGLEIAWTN